MGYHGAFIDKSRKIKKMSVCERIYIDRYTQTHNFYVVNISCDEKQWWVGSVLYTKHGVTVHTYYDDDIIVLEYY